MRDAMLVKTGVAGAVVAALCCATPALVLALGALGLSAWLDWADYVVIPALVAFVALAAYGFYRRRSAGPGACCKTAGMQPGGPSTNRPSR